MNEEWRNELITKGAAFDALNEVMIAYIPRLFGELEEIPLECARAIIKMPSAQPEIIRCRDCMHNGSFDTDCPIAWNGKEYCSFAERIDDE